MVPKLSYPSSLLLRCFRAVLFRMVPKLQISLSCRMFSFRAVLFRMVPKHLNFKGCPIFCFRAVLFRMVPKLNSRLGQSIESFRAVLFRMVPKHIKSYSFLSSFFLIQVYILYSSKISSNHVRVALPYICYLLRQFYLQPTTSKQCFEQPAASFLVCSLIFIEY